MKPSAFPESNVVFSAPADMGESQCGSIEGFAEKIIGGPLDGAPIMVVAWQPSPEDIEQMEQGKPIYLTMIGGLAPHFLSMSFEQAINA